MLLLHMVQHCINMIAASAARGREALANTASSNDEKIWTTAKNSVVRIAPRLRVNCKWPPMSYFCETGKMLCILKMNKTFFQIQIMVCNFLYYTFF